MPVETNNIPVCRNCGNSGRDMFGNACICGRAPKPDPNDLEAQLREAKEELARVKRDVENLKAGYRRLREDICNHAHDTVWVGHCETACERITGILGDDWEQTP